jgi:hypothetical protein
MLQLSVWKQKWKIKTNRYSSIKHNHVFLLAMTTCRSTKTIITSPLQKLKIKYNIVQIMLLYGILCDLERLYSTKLYKTI